MTDLARARAYIHHTVQQQRGGINLAAIAQMTGLTGGVLHQFVRQAASEVRPDATRKSREAPPLHPRPEPETLRDRQERNAAEFMAMLLAPLPVQRVHGNRGKAKSEAHREALRAGWHGGKRRTGRAAA